MLLNFILWATFPLLVISQQGASLTGEVSDAPSAPVGMVAVMLSSLDRVLQTETDRDGRFHFTQVPPGAYDLEFSAEGFRPQRSNIALASGEVRSLHVMLTTTGTMPDMSRCGPIPSIRYDASPTENRRLTGLVHEYSDTRPLAHAKVILRRDGKSSPVVLAHTGATGRFDLSAPAPGRYVLQVSRAGYRRDEEKQLLITRENAVFLDVSLLKRGEMVACE